VQRRAPRPLLPSTVRRLAGASALLVALVAVRAVARAQDEAPRTRPDAPVATARPAAADDRDILGPSDDRVRVESVMTRITSFNQYGHGYQSKAGPILGPGLERATILEPIMQVVASQGDRLRHVFTVPVDVVTAASPDAIDNGPDSVDVVSSASRHNIAATFDWTATYRVDPSSDLSMRSGLHVEEPFRSWHGGLGASRSLAGGDTLIAAGAIEVFDWFDRFDIGGHRHGRTDRSTTTASFGLTQILTPTTVVSANYGLTVQRGELGNTWNSVPLSSFDRGAELLPGERVRHALVGRASQFLPWDGALRLYSRLYRDDWGLSALSIEGQLMQRLSPAFYLGALYRFHTQTGVDFFTTLAGPSQSLRTADSDLAPLASHTIGGKIVLDLPIDVPARILHFEVGYERYFRTNDLAMDIVTWATGYRF
jgi:Protein of unknown function (DUF3570)